MTKYEKINYLIKKYKGAKIKPPNRIANCGNKTIYVSFDALPTAKERLNSFTQFLEACQAYGIKPNNVGVYVDDNLNIIQYIEI